ncbi:MAG: PRC-barrel domain protein [Firmicutes bacterium]|nr:PRC-barrel domain protein [Bacillota bacterium]
MKKSIDILGLPIISINEGSELGTAKGLVIDPAQGAVAAIVVEDGRWYLGAKLLPFAAVAGIGENALTIESSSHIIPIDNAPDLETLLEADVKVIGAKVLTKSGRFKGKITEIEMDEAGRIVNCEISNADTNDSIAGEMVITYGKGVVIISDSETATVVKPPVASPIPAKPPAVTVPEETVEPVEVNAATQPSQPDKTSEPAAAHTPAARPATESNDDLAKKFDDKQRKYLLGKKATRKIETDNGVMIVEQNGEITEEVIQKAKLAGKFVELSMSI